MIIDIIIIFTVVMLIFSFGFIVGTVFGQDYKKQDFLIDENDEDGYI